MRPVNVSSWPEADAHLGMTTGPLSGRQEAPIVGLLFLGNEESESTAVDAIRDGL